MFASKTTDTVTIPGDTPETVVIHKLSGKDYDAAQLAHMDGIASGRGRNWAQKFIQMAMAGVAKDADARRLLADPLAGFDRLALVKAGVTSWSCQENGEPKPVTAKAIEDLEDEPLEQLAAAILKLTKPSLFQAVDDAEAAAKND